MEIYYLPDQLKQILHYTDDNGIFTFASSYVEETEQKMENSPKEITKKMFCLTQLFIDHDKFLTQAYLKRLNPSYQVVKDENSDQKYFLFSANALAYFGLPNVNPKEEVEELFNFFENIKKIYIDFYQTFPNNFESVILHIFNSTPSFFKSIEFVGHKEKEDEAQWLKTKTEQLQESVKNSPVLTSWIKHTRRMLNIMGPYSWQHFSETSFFERNENPLEKRCLERPAEVTKILNERKKKEKQELKKRVFKY